MPNSGFSGIDLVRELRLRQWARQHYVTMDGRKSTWHPVVLDEMARRDRELLDDCARRCGELVAPAQTISSDALPALPTAEEFATGELEMEQSHPLDWQQPGSAYVPLAPSGDWRFHAAEVTPPKPHFAASLLNRTEPTYVSDLTAMR
ncbi:hypothetical protein [Schlesneria paludicola]|uniref:hypothetical protein n=1 Tax=Schlesneria paludicola TaxID=360056 RepID=UPI00031BF5B9|nr:hypothetical protein [Schlesneria paludicola]